MKLTSKGILGIFLGIILISSLYNHKSVAAYEREIEVVAAIYNATNKECPNKNGINLLKANYLLSVTSYEQRKWVDSNFNDVFYNFCGKLKKL